MGKLEIIAEPGTQQILMTREFDAPAELVYRAYTEPELLAQWLGPRRMTMVVERYENWDGGYWRFVHTDPEGNEWGFHGVMHGTPSLETLTFEEHDGKTRIRTNSVFQSVADRDGMIESGMEGGANDSMEKLDELLARMQAEQQATPEPAERNS